MFDCPQSVLAVGAMLRVDAHLGCALRRNHSKAAQTWVARRLFRGPYLENVPSLSVFFAGSAGRSVLLSACLDMLITIVISRTVRPLEWIP